MFPLKKDSFLSQNDGMDTFGNMKDLIGLSTDAELCFGTMDGCMVHWSFSSNAFFSQSVAPRDVFATSHTGIDCSETFCSYFRQVNFVLTLFVQLGETPRFGL